MDGDKLRCRIGENAIDHRTRNLPSSFHVTLSRRLQPRGYSPDGVSEIKNLTFQAEKASRFSQIRTLIKPWMAQPRAFGKAQRE